MGGSTLSIRLLTGLTLQRAGEAASTLSSPRLTALIAYLVLHRDRPVSRQVLAFTLWPESSEEKALGSLRRCVFELRQRLPLADEILVSDRHTLTWRSLPEVELDLERLRAALSARLATAADLPGLLAAYPGELLPECYDDWIVPHRRQLHEAFVEGLWRAAGVLEAQRAWAETQQVCQRLLALDPLNEETWRLAMRLCSLREDRAGVERYWRECVGVLQRELGTRPGAVTEALYARLLKAGSPRAAGRRPAATEAPFVGRRAEWEVLTGAWETALSGRLVIVTLEGEVGIGKSRLVEEWSDGLSRQGFGVHVARCHRLEREIPYHGVGALLSDVDLEGVDPSLRSVLAAVRGGGGGAPPDLAPEVAPLQGRQRLLDALLTVLVPPTPTLLLVDDLQWCDTYTVDWLRHVLRVATRRPLVLLVTIRLHERPAEAAVRQLLRELRLDPRTVRLQLHRLPTEDVRSLVEGLGGAQVEPATVQVLSRETEGNPLYLVELVRAGYLAEPSRASAPAGLRAVWEERLEELSPRALYLARLAALLGTHFDSELLLRLGGSHTEGLVQSIGELLERGILRERSPETLEFCHARLAAVTVAGMGASQQRLLHREIGRVLAQLPPTRREPLAAVIAQHLERGEELAQAAELYLLAARRAELIYAVEEAQRQHEKARSLARRVGAPALEWQALAALHRLASMRGECQRRRETLAQLAELTSQPGAPEAWTVELGLWQADFLLASDQSQLARDRALQVAALAEARGMAAAQAQALRVAAMSWLRLSPREPGIVDLLRSALGCAQAGGDRVAIADIRAMLDYQISTRGIQSLDLSAHLAAVEQARLAHDRLKEAQSLGRIGRLLLHQGDIPRAVRTFREALEVLDRVGPTPQRALHLTWLGLGEQLSGRYVQAHDALAEALEIGAHAGDPWREVLASGWLAETSVLLGDLPTARTWLERGCARVGALGTTHVHIHLCATAARLELAEGRPGVAWASIEQGWALIAGERSDAGGLSMDSPRANLAVVAAAVLLAQGQPAQALAQLEGIEALCIGADLWLYLPTARCLLMEAQVALGVASRGLAHALPLLTPGEPSLPMAEPHQMLFCASLVLAACGRRLEAHLLLERARGRLHTLAAWITPAADRERWLALPAQRRVLQAVSPLTDEERAALTPAEPPLLERTPASA